MKAYDAIVLGAGIAGLSVARELAKAKQRVLLIERDKRGGKASRAAAGILDPYSEAGEETPLLPIGLQAFEFYPSFLEEIEKGGEGQVEYEKLGLLYLALTSEDESLLRARFEWQKARRIPVEWLGEKAVRKLAPMVSRRTRSGVYFPQIAKLNAGKLTDALFEAAQEGGVEIRTGVEDSALWIEGGKVRGIEQSGEKMEAPAVALATGSWAGLQDKLGFRIPVKPVRGQILLLKAQAPFYPRTILHTIRYAYLVPWPENRLLVGSTLESAGFDDRVTSEGKEDILNRAGEMIESIRELPIESSWAALRPQAEGGMPLIGPAPVSGLFLAGGYYRSGVLIGPLVGKLLAEGIRTRKFSPLLEPFYPKEEGLL